MRKMGIDFGSKKVGIAFTDEAGKLAFPHDVIPNNDALLDTVEQLIADKGVTEVVIGHSLNFAGEPNPIQTDIETFIADLTLRVPVPIHLEPEQLTTQQAAAVTGKNKQTDAAAAALILDSWLQKQNSATPVEQAAAAVAQEAAIVPQISFDDFAKVEIKLGTIKSVEIVEGADKLLKLSVDLGEARPRQILSGIREFFADEQALVGKQCPFIANLAPRTIRGFESQGMILAGEADGVFTLLEPTTKLPPGTRLY